MGTTNRSETPEHVWMTHQRRNEPTYTRRQEQHLCEKSDPLRFPRQSNAQRSRENTQSRCTHAQDRSSQPPTAQAKTTADNDCHLSKMDSAAQREGTADHPTIQLRDPSIQDFRSSTRQETAHQAATTMRQGNEPYIPQKLKRGNHSATAGERREEKGQNKYRPSTRNAENGNAEKKHQPDVTFRLHAWLMSPNNRDREKHNARSFKIPDVAVGTGKQI